MGKLLDTRNLPKIRRVSTTFDPHVGVGRRRVARRQPRAAVGVRRRRRERRLRALEAVGQVIKVWDLSHEPPVYQAGEWITITADVYLQWIRALPQELQQLVHQPHTHVEHFARLKEYLRVPTARTTEITAVIDGQPQVLQSLAMCDRVYVPFLYVEALVAVAVSVCAVTDGFTHLLCESAV